jgi:hypothetical protein
LPYPLPLELAPSEWRRTFIAIANRRSPEDKDRAITDFIEARMPADRKRKGVPKDLMQDAKTKFGLNSKSAVLRALSRGKQLKKLILEGATLEGSV